MTKKPDRYAMDAVQMFMDANDLTLEEAIQEAGQRIRGAGRCYQKDVDQANLSVQFIGMDPAAGLVPGDKSRIKDGKHWLTEARRDLDRMAYWDSILKAAIWMASDDPGTPAEPQKVYG
jgi:hypothetical protein